MGASLGTGNRGVSALGASLVKLLSEANPCGEIGMMIGSRRSEAFKIAVNGIERSVPIVAYRLSLKAPLRQHLAWIALLACFYRFLPIGRLRRRIIKSSPWIKALAEADLVGDIRGGDSFSDIYGAYGFIVASLPVMTAIWVRGSVVMFPQTYGPFRSKSARLVARYILRHSSLILSRDADGISVAEQLAGPRVKAFLCPDVAFALDASAPLNEGIEPPWPASRPGCIIGLNVNGLMYNGGYSRKNMFGLELDYRDFLKRIIVALVALPSTAILIIPHTFAPLGNVESDPEASRKVIQELPIASRHLVHLMTMEHDQYEIKAIIGKCDFFIGSRMHSCIAALSQGLPTVGVAYSKKFKGVFETVGVGDWVVDARDAALEASVNLIVERVKSRETMRTSISGKQRQAQAILRDSFAHLIDGTHR
jgi:colanic acid/amylovoran biosynthesis protein